LEFFMPGITLHPTTRLAVWLLLLLAVQCLDGWVLVAVFAALPLLGRNVLRRGGRLAWRARWLLGSLLVIFSWGVAGEPLWHGIAAPTREGLLEAMTHLGRLFLVLIAVAAFFEALPLPELLTATHRLLQPLRRYGLDPDRGVVRLMLVLRYVETLPRPRDWRTLLDAPVAGVSEVVELNDSPLRWADYLVMLAAGAAVSVFCWP
jgi:energy-coupling factor transporter transmembrane protein EcfT